MKMFGLIPKPLRKIFKEVTHYACNSQPKVKNLIKARKGENWTYGENYGKENENKKWERLARQTGSFRLMGQLGRLGHLRQL